MLRCGCTSICLADRANKSNTTTPGNWSKVAAHGVRGLSKKSREETLLTGEFPDSLHSMALQTAVSRQSGNGNCPSAISTQPRLCCGCTSVYPKKPYWGWVSDTQTSQWFDVCWCFKPTKPIPSAPAKKTNSKPQRSDPGWSTALSLQHQVHTHTSKQHRTVKPAMSCWDFYTRVLVGQIPALSSVALEEFCWRKQQRNILCRAAPNTLLQRLTQSLTPDRKWEPSETLQIFISLPWNKISSGFLLNRNSKY